MKREHASFRLVLTTVIAMIALSIGYPALHPFPALASGTKPGESSGLANNVWYFAEGTTREGFDEWLTIQNPGAVPARVTATFMMSDGFNIDKKFDVPAKSRYTMFVRDVVGPERDVSTRVSSDNPVVVERPMYFNYQGVWSGGHCAIGATSMSTTWYFAEGTTRADFDEYLCIQNPGDTDASVHLEYMTSGNVNYFQDVTVPARSRSTVRPEDKVPEGEDISTQIVSTQPVVAERPMYYNFQGFIPGGDNVVGVSAPQKNWFFAEGYISPEFWTYLCIQNPGETSAVVRIYYLLTDGRVLFNEYPIAPKSRLTVNPYSDIGEAEFSIVIDSTEYVVAERPMYFLYKGIWPGGHNVMGAAAPGKEIYFAEGTTIEGFEEWVCMMNPNNDPAHLTFQIQIEGSTPMTVSYTVPAHSRYTVNMNETVGPGKNFSIKATSDAALVIERPMYFNYQGKWPGGHCVTGLY